MADLQERIAKLMVEIHDICEANGIRYYLDERQAIQAAVNHELDENVTSGVFLMKAEDLKKFIEVFEASPIEGRTIEYMKNNGNYPTLNIKYVDTGTVFYNMRRLACERCLGIYVSINLLKPVRRTSRAHQAMEQTWESMAYGEAIVGKKFGPVAAFRFRRSIEKYGRDKTASDLFDYLLEKYVGESRTGEYWTVKKTGKKLSKRRVPSLSERAIVNLYGHDFYTFALDEETVERRINAYNRKRKKTFTNTEFHFADVDVSYEDLHLERYRDTIRAIGSKSTRVKKKATRIRRKRNRFFNILYKTHARYYYALLFEDQIDDLERMFEEGRTDELEAIMDPYVNDLLKYKNIYISSRINNILRDHYELDLDRLFTEDPELHKEGVKIYDYNGNYIRTVAGTKDD